MLNSKMEFSQIQISPSLIKENDISKVELKKYNTLLD